MNKSIDSPIVSRLREIYEEDDIARRFCDWAALRGRDASETAVYRAAEMCHVAYGDMLKLFRVFDEIGLGTFKEGRKGYKTRIVWGYSLISVGKAGKGESQLSEIDVNELEPVENSVPAEYEIETISDRMLHKFRLRPDVEIAIDLPPDLSRREAERLASWVQTLPFD